MARPKGSKNKTTLLAEQEGTRKVAKSRGPDKRTDAEIVAEIEERFIALNEIVVGTSRGGRGCTGSGAPGIGKSFTVDEVLRQRKEDGGKRSIIVKGRITPVELYRLAYEYSAEGEVIVLDDADTIFDDEDGMNLLKALLDTPKDRTVSWYTNRTSGHEEGKEIGDDGEEADENKLPSSFTYRGSLIFFTNKDFQAYIDLGKGRYVEHMEALMNRGLYLDFKIHSRREVSLWTSHIVKTKKIMHRENVDEIAEVGLMSWLVEHANALRTMSIRTAIQLADIYKSTMPDGWHGPASHDKWTKRAAMFLLRD